MYNIYIDYTEGDSLGSQIVENRSLEIPTTSLSDAKENLHRIKAHYKKWVNDMTHNVERNAVEILTDNGTRKIPCFWMGYFEKLIRARVDLDDEGMSFEI